MKQCIEHEKTTASQDPWTLRTRDEVRKGVSNPATVKTGAADAALGEGGPPVRRPEAPEEEDP